jgi:uncharacterized protein (DUF58 family)
MTEFLPFLIILMVLAALFRADAVLTVFYLIIGAYIVSLWWSTTIMRRVKITRQFESRAFLDQEIPVTLVVSNPTVLPAVWLQLHESLPVDLIIPNFYHQVISIGPRKENTLTYLLHANKRGYYNIGPTFLRTGDLFGLVKDLSANRPADFLIVYPKIVPIPRLKLPSRSPFGTIKHYNPVFEDPSRSFGKREYRNGDSFKRIDWKATAISRRLQVKVFEPSIALETQIILNLSSEDYPIHNRYYDTELAIIIAASVANWAVENKQSVGVLTNGIDPLTNAAPPAQVPRRGSSHLMSILEILARVQTSTNLPFATLLHRSTAELSWGTTLILITSQLNEAIMDEIFQAQRLGLNPFILVSSFQPNKSELARLSGTFGIPCKAVRVEEDLQALF